MEKLHDLDVCYAGSSLKSPITQNTLIPHVKFTTSKKMEYQEIKDQSSPCVLSIIEVIPVFTNLENMDLKTAIALTKKPYLPKQWNF